MDIFINYKQGVEPDHSFARHLEKALALCGHRVFRDESQMRGGDVWADKLLRHLDSCGVVISLISDASMQSKWVLNEIDRAIEKKKHIIPIMLGPIRDDLMFTAYRPRLGDRHYVSYSGPLQKVTAEVMRSLDKAQRLKYEDLIDDALRQAGLPNPNEILCSLLWLLRNMHVLPAAIKRLDAHSSSLPDEAGTLAQQLASLAAGWANASKHNAGIERKAGDPRHAEQLEFVARRYACLAQILHSALKLWGPEVEAVRDSIIRQQQKRKEGKN